MYKFGNTSRKRLETCSKDIQDICNDAIQVIDFSIITGHRDKAKQDSLYPKFTKVRWPNSKHNNYPSMAVDIAPYIKPYGVLVGSPEQIADIAHQRGTSAAQARIFVYKAYARLIGVIEACAYRRNIRIRVGMDWDGDFDMLDQTFHDLMHVELKYG